LGEPDVLYNVDSDTHYLTLECLVMPSNRRDFLRSASATAALGLLTVPRTSPLFGLVPVDTPPGVTPGDPLLRDLAMRALNAATSAGARYADVRIQDSLRRVTAVGDTRVEFLQLQVKLLLGVRVIANGAWGFASTARLTSDDVERVARAAVAQAKANGSGRADPVALPPTPAIPNGAYTTPIKQDPFAVSFDDTVNLLIAAQEPTHTAAEAQGGKGGAVSLSADVRFLRETQSFASSEGSWIVQTLYSARGLGGGVGVSVVAPDHSDSYGRDMETFYRVSAGYEALTELNLAEAYPRLVEEARQLLHAKEVDVGRYDVVFDGYGVAGLLSASLAPAAELDRVLGYEQDIGTSYLAPPEKVLGGMHLGGPQLTIRADRTQARGRSTVGWDAEGVTPEPFTVVKDGVVVDYFTDREFAPRLASWSASEGRSVHSHGCAWAMNASMIQTICWPNLTMEPDPTGESVEGMIAATKKGLYFAKGVDGSLDPPLMNGMYFSEMVYEITNGKLGPLVKHAAIDARTTELWKSMDRVGSRATVAHTDGSSYKGDPGESYGATISAPAARVTQLKVVNYYRKEGDDA
jgi:TldD protein